MRISMTSALAPLLAVMLAGSPACAATPAEDVAAYLARIEAMDRAGPHIGAVIAVNPRAMDAARAAERNTGPLAGKAILVKDNIETADPMPTTAGSLALANNVTGRDAPFIARLRKAGGVILGKTNLSEWANFRSTHSISGWSAVGGLTRNPHATDRSACGSSAGSGAAVAAGFAWAAIGTETDGSVTCPASLNGVVGFKPTVGLVSRTYVVPVSHTQDTPGPMAASVHDAALLLTAMAGPDPADPATAEAGKYAVDFTAGLASASLKGVRIGVIRRKTRANPLVYALYDRALEDLKRAGAVLVDVPYVNNPAIDTDESVVLLYEFHHDLDAYLAGLPGRPPVRDLAGLIAFDHANASKEMPWFGQELFEEALGATDAAAYEKAREEGQRLAGPEGIDKMLADNNVAFLIAPTAAPAWATDFVDGGNYTSTGIGTLPAVAGYPHLTVPMGDVHGLPVGLSFVGKKWDDKRVLEAGAVYERVRSAPLAAPTFKPWSP